MPLSTISPRADASNHAMERSKEESQKQKHGLDM